LTLSADRSLLTTGISRRRLRCAAMLRVIADRRRAEVNPYVQQNVGKYLWVEGKVLSWVHACGGTDFAWYSC